MLPIKTTGLRAVLFSLFFWCVLVIMRLDFWFAAGVFARLRFRPGYADMTTGLRAAGAFFSWCVFARVMRT